MDESLLKCKELFHKRRKFFESIDVRIAAINHEDTWYNIRTRILLSSEKASGVTERKIDVGNFVISYKSIVNDEFLKLLDNIDNDTLEVDGLKIKFFNGQKHHLYFGDWCSRNSERAKERWNIDWPLDLFEWRVDHKLRNELSNIFKNINQRLNCYNPPYEDIYKAVRENFGLPEYYFSEHNGRDSICSILIPDYTAIEKCKLEGNNFVVEIKFRDSINVEDLRLNLIARGKKTNKFQIDFKGIPIETYPPFKWIRKPLVLEDVAEVNSYLFMKGGEMDGPSDQRQTRNLKSTLNLRLTAHEVFDEGAETLLTWLRGEEKRDRSRRFEFAVTTLLYMCGFQTEWIGRPGWAQEAPDIFAFCFEPQALIIGECTTKVPDINKIRVLRERADSLKEELKIEIHPMLFTCLKSLGDAVEKEARENWITTINSDKLKELFESALKGRPPKEALNILLGRGYWGV